MYQACHNKYAHLSSNTDLPGSLLKSRCLSLDSVLNAKVIEPFHNVVYLEEMKVLRNYVIKCCSSRKSIHTSITFFVL